MAELAYNQVAKIKVFGIGGAGSNAVNRMVDDGVQGVEFYVANTDLQRWTHPVYPTRSSSARKVWAQAETRTTAVRQQ